MMQDLNEAINRRIKELEIALDTSASRTLPPSNSDYMKGRRDQQICENIFLHSLKDILNSD